LNSAGVASRLSLVHRGGSPSARCSIRITPRRRQAQSALADNLVMTWLCASFAGSASDPSSGRKDHVAARKVIESRREARHGRRMENRKMFEAIALRKCVDATYNRSVVK